MLAPIVRQVVTPAALVSVCRAPTSICDRPSPLIQPAVTMPSKKVSTDNVLEANVINPLSTFAKSSYYFIKKCEKPDRKRTSCRGRHVCQRADSVPGSVSIASAVSPHVHSCHGVLVRCLAEPLCPAARS